MASAAATELTPAEFYIHIFLLILTGVLMTANTFQFCISSIQDQPKIFYRFASMLFCFVQLLVLILSTIYFQMQNTNHRHAIALLIRLCSVMSHSFGVICCYCFLSTIVRAVYTSSKNKTKLPKYIISLKIFCAILPSLDISLAVIAFISDDAHFQNIFMLILQFWIFIFCAFTQFLLFRAAKKLRTILTRTQSAHSFNKSESLSVHLLDFNENESALSTYVNRQRYNTLERQLYRMYFLILLNCVTLIIVICSMGYLYTVLVEHGFWKMSESPMASIESYLISTVIFILALMALVYWLYVPWIAKDSLCYFCFGHTKCFEWMPNAYKESLCTDDLMTFSPQSTNTTNFDLFSQEEMDNLSPLMSYSTVLSGKRGSRPMIHLELAPIHEHDAVLLDDKVNKIERFVQINAS